MKKLNWKIINFIFIFTTLICSVCIIIKVWYEAKMLVSPLLPKYTVIFTNGTQINIICFALAGIIPTFFLRIRKHYLISSICLAIFFIIGYLLKDSVKIYKHFYSLSRYLE